MPSDSNSVASVFTPSEPVIVGDGSGGGASRESKPIPIGLHVSSIIFVHASAKPARNRPAYDATWNYPDTADLLGWYELTYDDVSLRQFLCGMRSTFWNRDGARATIPETSHVKPQWKPEKAAGCSSPTSG